MRPFHGKDLNFLRGMVAELHFPVGEFLMTRENVPKVILSRDQIRR